MLYQYVTMHLISYIIIWLYVGFLVEKKLPAELTLLPAATATRSMTTNALIIFAEGKNKRDE